MSLAEVLVSGVLSIGVLSAVGTMVIQTATITANAAQSNRSNAVASNVANEVTAVVRVATTLAVSGQTLPNAAVIEANKERLVLYSLSNVSATNPAPVKVTFSVLSDPTGPKHRTVQEQRCTATASSGFWVFGACTTQATTNLGGRLEPQTTTYQLFRYYNSAGVELTNGSSALTATQRDQIAKIQVEVRVKADGSNTAAAVLKNLVVLGNLGLETTT